MNPKLALPIRGFLTLFVGTFGVAACTIPFEAVADEVIGDGSIDSLFVIQSGDTTTVFPIEDVFWQALEIFQPDTPFQIRWRNSGNDGILHVLVSHPMCNHGGDPEEPREVPGCPQLQLEVPRSCMREGNAFVSGLPGGYQWSTYDVVVRYRTIYTGEPSQSLCDGAVAPNEQDAWWGPIRMFGDFIGGNSSAEGWESITISELVP